MTLSTPLLARRQVRPHLFHHEPVWVDTLGPEVADVCADAGYVPDAEQAGILDAIFAFRPDRRSVVFDTTVIAARQSIKTGVAKMAVLGWLFVTEQRLIVWSAHEMDTTREAHGDLAVLIENFAPFARQLKPSGILYGNNLQIETRDRRRVKFKARTTGGGRGLTGDKIVLDEGFALKPSHIGALLPTLNAIVDPQIVIPSSAGMLSSAVLRQFRDRGRAGTGARSAYFEWGAPEEPCADDDCSHLFGVAKGCALDREDLWERAITTYGTRTGREKIASFRETMPWEEFAREFLVWWDDPTGSGPFPKGVWARQNAARLPENLEPGEDLTVVESQIVGDVKVAVDVSPDRRSGALAVAGVNDTGRTQVELVDEDARGIDWLAARAAAVVAAHGAQGVHLDPSAGAGGLVKQLHDLGVQVFDVTGRAYGQACGAFYDGIINDTIVHIGQLALDTAVGGAVKKNSGDAFVWDRRKGADIPQLCAATIAAWAVGEGGDAGFYTFTDVELAADDLIVEILTLAEQAGIAPADLAFGDDTDPDYLSRLKTIRDDLKPDREGE